MFLIFISWVGWSAPPGRGFPSHCLRLRHGARDPLKKSIFSLRFFLCQSNFRAWHKTQNTAQSQVPAQTRNKKKKQWRQDNEPNDRCDRFVRCTCLSVVSSSHNRKQLQEAHKKKVFLFIYLLGTFQLIIINISLCRYNVRYIRCIYLCIVHRISCGEKFIRVIKLICEIFVWIS